MSRIPSQDWVNHQNLKSKKDRGIELTDAEEKQLVAYEEEPPAEGDGDDGSWSDDSGLAREVPLPGTVEIELPDELKKQASPIEASQVRAGDILRRALEMAKKADEQASEDKALRDKPQPGSFGAGRRRGSGGTGPAD
ncbi:hypothetical protein [Methylobacterium radiotolerans]|uniref:hypothetical protein n=1 Tax=Methylobacterium radiotolerans TaxID=31998 RepID=UPI0015F74344|nr:hypothetical protein [Methylobacterium radiotolerans]